MAETKRRLNGGGESNDGFARGWYVVCTSAELQVGAVLPLRYFGKHLVAFRGDDGQAVVLDAHCPHLGAHLGVGGKVVGNDIQCPFHAWRFGADGRCTEIPYAKKIPPRAVIPCWRVSEHNGLVHVWHARGDFDRAPDFEVPVIEELSSDDWLPWEITRLEIATQQREIVENIADKAHFPVVHGTFADSFSAEFEGHLAIQKVTAKVNPRGGGTDYISTTTTNHGPGIQITEMDTSVPNKLLNAHTPIDEGHLHLWFGVMLKKTPGMSQETSSRYIDNLTRGYHEDVEIWEHKKWRDRPMLCDGDGPIGKLRKWYRQFYDNAGAA